MKKAIITGCTGTIGISLINQLINNGWQVTAVPRVESSRLDNIPKGPNVRIVECNLKEISQLPQLIQESHDVFFHLAWDGTYGSDRTDCLRQNQNVLHTLHAVEAAKKLNCSVFVGAGSQSECGQVNGIIHPDTYCKPETSYGAAKLSACCLSRVLCKQLEIRHEWCRVLSVFGPYDGKHTLVMTIINDLLNGIEPTCTPGNQIWDYIYSKDAAKAFRLVAENGIDGEIYCIGSGQVRTLREYILAIRDSVDSNLPIGFGKRAFFPNQVMHLEADISTLQKDTGFVADYSFEAGIAETIQWCKENSLI